MTIGILTAMQKEHDLIQRLLTDPHLGEAGVFPFTLGSLTQAQVVLMQSGIGKVNATLATAQLIHHYHPDLILSTGCAGATSPSIHVMDVVVSESLVQHDFYIGMGLEPGHIQGLPRFFQADSHLLAIARQLHDPSLHVGLIASGDQFISSPEQLAHILSLFPQALAVDMESAAIAQTCYLYKVPFLSFRTISDTPGADHHQQQYEDFWHNIADHSFQLTHRFLQAL